MNSSFVCFGEKLIKYNREGLPIYLNKLVPGWKMRFLLVLLLPLCSPAPLTEKEDVKDHSDIDVNVEGKGMHKPRGKKFFHLGSIHMGDISVDSATGDNMEIGHKVNINVHGHAGQDHGHGHSHVHVGHSHRHHVHDGGKSQEDILNARINEIDENLEAIGELSAALQSIEDGMKALSKTRKKRSDDKQSSDETILLELIDRVTNLVEKCGNGGICESNKIKDVTQKISSTFNKIKESGSVSYMFQNSFDEKKGKLEPAISTAVKTQIDEKAKALTALAIARGTSQDTTTAPTILVTTAAATTMVASTTITAAVTATTMVATPTSTAAATTIVSTTTAAATTMIATSIAAATTMIATSTAAATTMIATSTAAATTKVATSTAAATTMIATSTAAATTMIATSTAAATTKVATSTAAATTMIATGATSKAATSTAAATTMVATSTAGATTKAATSTVAETTIFFTTTSGTTTAAMTVEDLVEEMEEAVNSNTKLVLEVKDVKVLVDAIKVLLSK